MTKERHLVYLEKHKRPLHPDPDMRVILANRERKKLLKKRYNITPEEYDALFEEQNGKCLICGEYDTKRKLNVDHSHKTGVIRGLLCTTCNRGIGFFKDDVEKMSKAILYLKKFNRENVVIPDVYIAD